MSRFVTIALVLIWGLVWVSPAFAGVQTQSDDELTAKIVGEWFVQDQNGSTTYTFKKDGTWTEVGVYFFPDGDKQVTIGGEWYVRDGFFYHSVLESNVPSKIKLGRFEKIKIKEVTDDEFFLKLKPGKTNPHLDP